jgi:hypothetical protein
MIIPPMLCRKPAIRNGGNDSTPILMAKNVVPQKIETAANASQAYVCMRAII